MTLTGSGSGRIRSDRPGSLLPPSNSQLSDQIQPDVLISRAAFMGQRAFAFTTSQAARGFGANCVGVADDAAGAPALDASAFVRAALARLPRSGLRGNVAELAAFWASPTIRSERAARFGHFGLTGGMRCCRQLPFKCGYTKIACGRFFRKCLKEALSPLCASLLWIPARCCKHIRARVGLLPESDNSRSCGRIALF